MYLTAHCWIHSALKLSPPKTTAETAMTRSLGEPVIPATNESNFAESDTYEKPFDLLTLRKTIKLTSNSANGAKKNSLYINR